LRSEDKEEFSAEGEPDFDKHWNFTGVILEDNEKHFQIFWDLPVYSDTSSDGKKLVAVMKVFEDGWLEGLYLIVADKPT